MEKTIYFKRTKIIKVNDIRFPVSKPQLLVTILQKSAVTGSQNTTNPDLKIFS